MKLRCTASVGVILACLAYGLDGLLCAAARVDGEQLAIRRKDVLRSKPAAFETSFRKDAKRNLTLPEPTSYGYLDVNPEKGSAMYYMYFEAQEASPHDKDVPIILWLQGGPGCSSFFGMLYINGPYFVNDDLTLRRNLGSWNRMYGMLFIEQPIGVGFSKRGSASIPDNELDVAWDLYRALQSFYRTDPELQSRPLIITGESYAGKYVPSISHFILQVCMKLSQHVEAPVFTLGGLAVGNGFTDAETQTAVQAEVAWGMGLIDTVQRRVAEGMQQEIIELVRSREWRAARNKSDALLRYISTAGGAATLEDVRRNTGYDSRNQVDEYLNSPPLRQLLAPSGVPPASDLAWESCSGEVDAVMGHDVMKSVKGLVSDLLQYKPVLLYQGQWDAECGVGSNDAWIHTLQWHGHGGFTAAPRKFWWVNGRIAGFWKSYNTLDLLVLRNTGHMVPHDNPLVSRTMSYSGL
ncbi:hypothetical protein VOLCADRAFT_66092 [Volvox carteri f. nagariensis]|uniref:Carboxypeptidase n=1 Tax=Volvox carteri f. nagariensis TaxID=3068 RepID=D8UAB7_VOLCA|nr:uncharacterized protein VOLCADRAFT_66092 [Volvox carteri f. nagariensis]EFJ43239.1 hypothetical protein VOLCADRAFT_66092 [Volvox carteri f. nagariensis]|eukprot:XP_002955599.1 hypothetical protein VOLCADRAFT_66092 [Volvox carteri f. nagariensis]